MFVWKFQLPSIINNNGYRIILCTKTGKTLLMKIKCDLIQNEPCQHPLFLCCAISNNYDIHWVYITSIWGGNFTFVTPHNIIRYLSLKLPSHGNSSIWGIWLDYQEVWLMLTRWSDGWEYFAVWCGRVLNREQ
jgi:hypothetical protein